MIEPRDYAAIALDYARGTVEGRIPAARWQVAACARQLHDLAREGTPEFPYRYDAERGARVCLMMELLPHVKGRWKTRTLRLEPWQVFLLMTLFSWICATAAHADESMRERDGLRRYRTAYIEVPRKNAKALALDTPIPTPTGWTTMGDVKVGDLVYDERGEPCRVVAATDVMHDHECYRLTFSDGSSIVADAGHEWFTVSRRTGLPRTGLGPKATWRERHIRTSEQIAATLRVGREHNHRVPVAGILKSANADLPLDPYLLGYWLGDGHTDAARITVGKQDGQALDLLRATGEPMIVRELPQQYQVSLTAGRGKRSDGKDSVRARLRDLGVLGNKHIPSAYLRASESQRRALLAGLMDSDGTAAFSGPRRVPSCSFATTSPALRDGILELVRSLGMKPQIQESRARLYGRDCGAVYNVQFTAYAEDAPFRLNRKLERLAPAPEAPTRARNRRIVGCDRVASVPVRCIQVDSPSHLYLAGESMVPTHNSTIAAGLGLFMLGPDGEPGAEVYSAATTREQAKIVFNTARQMAMRTPAYCDRFGVEPGIHALVSLATEASFKALSSDDQTLDGLNPHAAIVDELHAHRTRGVWDVLETATGARSQSLLLAITTAGSDRSGICFEVRSYLLQILEGALAKTPEVADARGYTLKGATTDDESFFGIVYTIDEDDDWTSPEAWAKANPNLGVSVKTDDIARACQKAMRLPSAQPNFLTKRLNVWVNADSAWMDMRAWSRCGDSQLRIEQFAGTPAIVALDLSSKTDIAAAAILFRRVEREKDKHGEDVDRVHYYAFGRYYLPEETIEESDNSQYRGWADSEFLIETDGNTTDFARIREDLVELRSTVAVAEVGIDVYQARQLGNELQEDGLAVVEIPMTVKQLSEPMKELEAAVLGGRFHHDGNPALAWMMSNVVAHRDRKDNIFPAKPTANAKIDGAVALIMAMSRALVAPAPPARSVYETRGPSFA
ncbi:MAG: hypothetical protein C0503_00825 [Gemmatimonas sp.]|nr:hypothetical protein [Gemmatimonas sp.]